MMTYLATVLEWCGGLHVQVVSAETAANGQRQCSLIVGEWNLRFYPQFFPYALAWSANYWCLKSEDRQPLQAGEGTLIIPVVLCPSWRLPLPGLEMLKAYIMQHIKWQKPGTKP